jgi:hypothetical protein
MKYNCFAIVNHVYFSFVANCYMTNISYLFLWEIVSSTSSRETLSK